MATKVKDYKLDEDFDLFIGSNGDFKQAPSDQNSSILLLNTNVGAWKQSPFCGANLAKYEGSTGTQAQMRRDITVQHEADGFKVNAVIVKNYSEFYLDIIRSGFED